MCTRCQLNLQYVRRMQVNGHILLEVAKSDAGLVALGVTNVMHRCRIRGSLSAKCAAAGIRDAMVFSNCSSTGVRKAATPAGTLKKRARVTPGPGPGLATVSDGGAACRAPGMTATAAALLVSVKGDEWPAEPAFGGGASQWGAPSNGLALSWSSPAVSTHARGCIPIARTQTGADWAAAQAVRRPTAGEAGEAAAALPVFRRVPGNAPPLCELQKLENKKNLLAAMAEHPRDWNGLSHEMAAEHLSNPNSGILQSRPPLLLKGGNFPGPLYFLDVPKVKRRSGCAGLPLPATACARSSRQFK